MRAPTNTNRATHMIARTKRQGSPSKLLPLNDENRYAMGALARPGSA